MSEIVLRKVAPWNSALRNTYRERYTEVGGRYFKVSADGLDTLWDVTEIDADGGLLFHKEGTDLVLDSWSDFAFTLAEAREKIAAEVAAPEAAR
jgi:hypothetical protein